MLKFCSLVALEHDILMRTFSAGKNEINVLLA